MKFLILFLRINFCEKQQAEGYLLERSLLNLLLFCLSVILLAVALLIFPWPITPQERGFSYQPKGFVFGSSEKLLEESTSIYMEFYSLVIEEGTINVTIRINYVCENSSSFENAFFVF